MKFNAARIKLLQVINRFLQAFAREAVVPGTGKAEFSSRSGFVFELKDDLLQISGETKGGDEAMFFVPTSNVFWISRTFSGRDPGITFVFR